ncbi:PARP1 [Symbiodinium natans]|uniref:Poly [ADP-ribose] polymerase n=1 Tax=Symbiodinium natans TaxID=878477 RepID=A0A812M3X1_9DINO|nr:PARP1 [Symbiodinium natans]
MYDSEEWCSPPQIEIIRISEVFNPIVNNAYYQQLSQMQEVWGTDRQPIPEMSRAIPIRTAWDRNRMNEVLLFHGCKWDSLFGILRRGFDPRLGGINTGAAFGIGCYFTTVASKADAYTERWEEWEGRPNCEIPADLRCLLVARVALGEIFELREADASLRRPPTGAAPGPIKTRLYKAIDGN